MTKEDLIKNPKNCGSHIVLLGAGASRAAFPNGDVSGNKLPVMNDLIEIIGLKPLFEKYSINSSGNFEAIYTKIENENLRKEIEEKIHDYFSKLSLPDEVTHYDRLLLSLRKKDAIFTFNWDPFLYDAYVRNNNVVSLPGIYFLHGNVRIGSCEKHDDQWGLRGNLCPECNKPFSAVPLLYPIEKKNYFDTNQYTAQRWKCAEELFSNAFTITVFGYSAPSSDIEAVELIKNAWFKHSKRKFEHVEVIDINKSDTYESWKKFTPTYHLHMEILFEGSRLCRWPRRSCESLIYPMRQGIPCDDFPLPATKSLEELQQYIKEIAKYEQKNG